MIYRLTYGLKDVGSHETFKQAFLALHRLVMEDKKISDSFIATIWMVVNGHLMQFHEICGEAFRQGLIDEEGRLKPCVKTKP